jgi:hypothetical protein
MSGPFETEDMAVRWKTIRDEKPRGGRDIMTEGKNSGVRNLNGAEMFIVRRPFIK